MAYSALRKDGKIKDFIQARKDKKEVTQATSDMTLKEMKYKANIGNFKDQGSQTFYRGRGSNVETFTTGTKQGWVSSSGRIDPSKSESSSSKFKETSKKAGGKALDIIAPLVPGLGRKRTFVSGAQQEGSNHVIGSGSGFNEKVDVPTNPRTGNERFRFGEYQRFKKEKYTPEQRSYNIKANVRNKGMLGTIAGLTTFGSGFKHGEKNQKIVKDLIKKGVKKIKRIIN